MYILHVLFWVCNILLLDIIDTYAALKNISTSLIQPRWWELEKVCRVQGEIQSHMKVAARPSHVPSGRKPTWAGLEHTATTLLKVSLVICF